MLASPYYHGDSLYVELVNAVDLIDMNQIKDPVFNSLRLCGSFIISFTSSNKHWVLGYRIISSPISSFSFHFPP